MDDLFFLSHEALKHLGKPFQMLILCLHKSYDIFLSFDAYLLTRRSWKYFSDFKHWLIDNGLFYSDAYVMVTYG